MSFFKKATLATVVGATALTAATPAMADHYRHHRRGGDTTGAAIAGGVIGLALGAIIASSVDNDRDDYRYRYVDRGWTWRDGYYWDRHGRRYYRDGRAYRDHHRYEGHHYYDRRGYSYGDRGYYGRDGYYGERRYRHGY